MDHGCTQIAVEAANERRTGFRTEPFLQHFRENDFPFACWKVKGLRRVRMLSARRSQVQRICLQARRQRLTFVWGCHE